MKPSPSPSASSSAQDSSTVPAPHSAVDEIGYDARDRGDVFRQGVMRPHQYDASDVWTPEELVRLGEKPDEILGTSLEFVRRAESEKFGFPGLIGMCSTAADKKAELDHIKKAANIARIAAKKRKIQRDADAGIVPKPLTEEVIKFITRHRSDVEKAQRRHQDGFEHDGIGEVAGFRYPAFSEMFHKVDDDGNVVDVPLRSQIGCPIMAILPACFPRASKLPVGMDKTFVKTVSHKVLALDYPYATFGENRMLTMVVVELDSRWESVDALRNALLTLLPAEAMPSFAVGRYENYGRVFVRPHVGWILKNAVWDDLPREYTDDEGKIHRQGDKRCKRAPVNLYYLVQRALTKLLLPLGADPSCLNITKPKNPLSPFWTTVIMNDNNLHTLKDLRCIRGMDLSIRAHEMAKLAKEAAVMHSGQPVSTSNAVWISAGNEIIFLLKRSDKSLPADYSANNSDKVKFRDWITEKIRPILVSEYGEFDGLDYVIDKRVQFFVKIWKPKERTPVMRGRDGDGGRLDQGFLSRAERELLETKRKSEAGTNTGRQKRARTKQLLARGIGTYLRRGHQMIKSDVIKFLVKDGFAKRATAYELWDEVLPLVTESSELPSC